jgi:hypothetical protein
MSNLLLEDLKFDTNPFYVESERLTVELHFAEEYHRARFAAECTSALRERVQYLRDEERERLAWIDEDLRLTTGARTPRGNGKRTPVDVWKPLNQAWERDHNPTEVLRLLRASTVPIDDWRVAYMRAVCYKALGHKQVACLFLRLSDELRGAR